MSSSEDMAWQRYWFLAFCVAPNSELTDEELVEFRQLRWLVAGIENFNPDPELRRRLLTEGLS